MKSSWWYRFVFLIGVVVISVIMIIPTVFNFDDDTDFLVKSKINLGLDLQGGLYMILGIDFNRVYRDEIKNYAVKFTSVLKDAGVAAQLGDMDLSEATDPKYSIILNSPEDIEKAKNRIKSYFPQVVRLTHEEGTKLQYGITSYLKNDIESQAVSKSIEVIRNRIDEFGVTEPEIFSQGSNRIVVQLPGIRDIERAKALIGKTAKLEFKMVDDAIPAATIQGFVDKATKAGIVYDKGKQRFSDYLDTLNHHLKDDLPKGFSIAFQKKNVSPKSLDEKKETMIPFLVESVSKITGDDLQDASVQIDQRKNEPYVSMTFKSAGAKKFEEETAANIGKRMAVILDGNVYTAPMIQQRIGGGNAQITLGYGNFNDLLKQAKDIALVLRAGALPVQLDFEEQRIVGPSLGTDSIRSAKYASFIGCMMVFLFILVYYKISGLIGIVSLVLNVLIVVACLVGLEATLTLPGIAGIALTVGMAVDATIIIYERIREELRKGTSNYKAFEEGFNQAFWTIVDANITTALAGFCLLNFGTGPIRGFAVTLLIGIVATVYTAYFAGRLFFELYLKSVGGKDLSI